MILNIQQSIHIQMIKIGGISNSSVFQIGTSGIITPSSHLYNTGGYEEPAPLASVMANLNTEIALVPL